MPLSKKPVELKDVPAEVKNLTGKFVTGKLFNSAEERARIEVLRHMRENRIWEIDRKTLHKIVKRTLAEVQRRETEQIPRVKRSTAILGKTLAAKEQKLFAAVAAALSPTHAKIAELVAQGKKIGEISSSTGLAYSTVSSAISSIKFHIGLAQLTGRFPNFSPPGNSSVATARQMLQSHFPQWAKRNKIQEAVALAIEGRLPVYSNYIHMARKVVEASQENFPLHIRKLLEREAPSRTLLEPVMDKIKIAGQRGDQVAINILRSIKRRHGKNPRGVAYTSDYVDDLANGRGLPERHPDLFLGTVYAPVSIRGINPHSLATKKKAIDALVKRGEEIGKIMELFAAGSPIEEIAEKMKRNPLTVKRKLTVGAHAVFRMEPKTDEHLLAYKTLLEKHHAVFKQKYERGQKQ